MPRRPFKVKIVIRGRTYVYHVLADDEAAAKTAALNAARKGGATAQGGITSMTTEHVGHS